MSVEGNLGKPRWEYQRGLSLNGIADGIMRKNRQKGMNGSKGNDYSVISNYSADPLHISTR